VLGLIVAATKMKKWLGASLLPRIDSYCGLP
jgi:hypothetical protein